MKTYNHMYSIAFSLPACHEEDGDKLDPATQADNIRAAVLMRIMDLSDGELIREAIELCDTYEEQRIEEYHEGRNKLQWWKQLIETARFLNKKFIRNNGGRL